MIKRMVAVAGLTVGVLALGSSSAWAAFPPAHSTPFTFRNVGKVGSCLELSRIGNPYGSVATQKCSTTPNRKQQWTRDPSTGVVRNVDNPNFCLTEVTVPHTGVFLGAINEPAQCRRVDATGPNDLKPFITINNKPLYFEATRGKVDSDDAIVALRFNTPGDPYQEWRTPAV